MIRTGGCNCGAVRYQIGSEPLFVHVCHCSECQHESGSAFQMTVLILGKDFEFVKGEPDIRTMARKSGNEYRVYSCNKCSCTLAGHSIESNQVMVVRPGTLDNTSWISPQAHIWIKEKQDWVELPENIPYFDAGYDAEKVWPEASLKRVSST